MFTAPARPALPARLMYAVQETHVKQSVQVAQSEHLWE